MFAYFTAMFSVVLLDLCSNLQGPVPRYTSFIAGAFISASFERGRRDLGKRMGRAKGDRNDGDSNGCIVCNSTLLIGSLKPARFRCTEKEKRGTGERNRVYGERYIDICI